jgi:hypothetical protein
MSAFIIGLFIVALGIILGALLMWFYMNGRVEWWIEKYEMEKRLKDKLMEKGEELLKTELRMFNDIRSAFKGKAK